MSLVRRTLGALPDAAWLRRQFTLDAEVVRDAQYGLRLLARSPAFSTLAVLILAIGIGAGTTIFSLVDALLLRSLPYTDPDRVVTLWQRDTRRGTEPDEVAPGNFADWRARSQAFEILAAAEPYAYDYTSGGEPEVFMAAVVTEGFFEAIGIRPLLGRTFQPQDYVAGQHRVAVLSHALWQRSFARRADIVGQAVTLDTAAYTIVGVLPPYVELTTDERAMGVFIVTLIAVLFVVPMTSPDPTERPPLLDSPLFIAHVVSVLIAYASFALACVLSVTYLLLFRELKRKQPGVFFARLPPLRSLDVMNVRAVTIGLVFLTLSLVIGVVWIGEAQQYAPNDPNVRQMSLGDPKILVAVISWLLFAFQLYARQVLGWGGRRAAWLSVAGFASIFVNLLPVAYFFNTSHTFV